MRPFAALSFFVCAATSVFGILEIGAPANGAVLGIEEDFTAQIVQPLWPISCVDVGIALAIASCNHGGCPDPSNQLGSVLYTGPYSPTPHSPGGFYQNFTLQVPKSFESGSAVFTFAHFCLLGGGPTPLLEYGKVSVTVE